MKVSYYEIKKKGACKEGLLWWLETFGKESVEYEDALKKIKKVSESWFSWFLEKFPPEKFFPIVRGKELKNVCPICYKITIKEDVFYFYNKWGKEVAVVDKNNLWEIISFCKKCLAIKDLFSREANCLLEKTFVFCGGKTDTYIFLWADFMGKIEFRIRRFDDTEKTRKELWEEACVFYPLALENILFETYKNLLSYSKEV